MKPNSRSMESLREFFKTYEGLTNTQLAIIADVATRTIVDWKRKCGVIQSNYKKPPKKPKGPTPKNWDNKEWFEETYEKMGLRAIGLLLKKDWKFVASRLKKYGIPRKTHAERMASKNPCCDESWLYYYYADREDYVKWCKKQDIKPCPKGGKRLNITECGKLAGVSHYTISLWLASHKMKIRSAAEALSRPSTQIETNEKRRKCRDKFFENYRKGTINIIVGPHRFSNGYRMDRTEIIAKKFNAKIRGISPHPKGPQKS